MIHFLTSGLEKMLSDTGSGKVSFDQGKNLRRMVFVGKNMNPLSTGILQFFPANIHIDMRLKMFLM